jgi:hypothetical protein
MTRLPAIVPLGFGIIIGLLVFNNVQNAESPSPVVVAAPDAEGTMAVNVNVTILEPTTVPTEIPTLYPTSTTKRDRVDVCGTATPGAICEWPQPTALPPTAYPSCSVATKGGTLCQWATVTT